MMASVASEIIAAPFAVIGSIGVYMALPNFHKFLKDKKIEFEELTAGPDKRNLTTFSPNTKDDGKKHKNKLTIFIDYSLTLSKSIGQHRSRKSCNWQNLACT